MRNIVGLFVKSSRLKKDKSGKSALFCRSSASQTKKMIKMKNKKIKNKLKKIDFSYLETLLQQYTSNRIFFDDDEDIPDT